MSISLNKGQTISLSKDGGRGLTKVFMGCGWDPAQPKNSGFLGGLLGGGRVDEIDLDASVILYDAAKNVVDMVWFQQLRSQDGFIEHGGDNLTGDGDGDDEVIHVNLEGIAGKVKYLVFTVNSFRGQTFNEVDNAFVRLVDDTNGKEICKYTLTEQGPHTGVIMASMEKTGSGWKMTAHGKPAGGRSAKDLVIPAAAIL
ncbi:MAG: TerD family protein [Rhodobacteraceae bacterium]|nr:TerD family protein [Paracoccaceae bacterium]